VKEETKQIKMIKITPLLFELTHIRSVCKVFVRVIYVLVNGFTD